MAGAASAAKDDRISAEAQINVLNMSDLIQLVRIELVKQAN